MFERYYNGCDHTESHHIASVTKSVLSALIGIGIDKGYIAGVDQKVIDFFPEFSLDEHEYLKRELTVKHLLTMTASCLCSLNFILSTGVLITLKT